MFHFVCMLCYYAFGEIPIVKQTDDMQVNLFVLQLCLLIKPARAEHSSKVTSQNIKVQPRTPVISFLAKTIIHVLSRFFFRKIGL